MVKVPSPKLCLLKGLTLKTALKMRDKAPSRKGWFSHTKAKALRRTALAKFRGEPPRRKSQFAHTYANVPYNPDYQPSISVDSQVCDDKLLEKCEHFQQKKHRVQHDQVGCEEIVSHSGPSVGAQLPVSNQGRQGNESLAATDVISSKGRRVTRSSSRAGGSEREGELILSNQSLKHNSSQSYDTSFLPGAKQGGNGIELSVASQTVSSQRRPFTRSSSRAGRSEKPGRIMGDQREAAAVKFEEDGHTLSENMAMEEEQEGQWQITEEQLAEILAPTGTNSQLLEIPSIVSMTPADLTGSEALKCLLCDHEFPSFQLISTHYNSFHSDIDSYRCLECEELFASFSDIRNHMRSHGYSCNVCGKVFYVLLTLLNHKMGHLEGTNPHKCAKCRIGFSRAAVLYNHMKSVHPNVQPDYPCTLCKKRFTRRAELISHQSFHTGIHPFPCCLCPKAFGSKAEAKIHRVTHRNVVEFQCNVCPSKFAEKHLLVVHKLAHIGTNQFVCQTCGDSFTLRKALDRHITSQHSVGNLDLSDAEVESKPHTLDPQRAQVLIPKRNRPNRTHVLCPICGKDSVGTKLKRHMLTHTDYRPFECRFCGKRFRQSFNLRIHTNLHTGNKPYKCNLCGEGFPSAAGLVSHEIYKHEALAAQKKAERETKGNVMREGSQKRFSREMLHPAQNIPAKGAPPPCVKAKNKRALKVRGQNGPPTKRRNVKAQRVPVPDVHVRNNPKQQKDKAQRVPEQDVRVRNNSSLNGQVNNNAVKLIQVKHYPIRRKVKTQRYPAPDVQVQLSSALDDQARLTAEQYYPKRQKVQPQRCPAPDVQVHRGPVLDDLARLTAEQYYPKRQKVQPQRYPAPDVQVQGGPAQNLTKTQNASTPKR